MKQLLLNIMQSKHTSLAGIGVGICGIGRIWFPKYAEQFKQTQDFLMTYGLIMAAQIGNGKPSGKPDATQETKQNEKTNP